MQNEFDQNFPKTVTYFWFGCIDPLFRIQGIGMFLKQTHTHKHTRIHFYPPVKWKIISVNKNSLDHNRYKQIWVRRILPLCTTMCYVSCGDTRMLSVHQSGFSFHSMWNNWQSFIQLIEHIKFNSTIDLNIYLSH